MLTQRELFFFLKEILQKEKEVAQVVELIFLRIDVKFLAQCKGMAVRVVEYSNGGTKLNGFCLRINILKGNY